jgi:glycine/D-amino acid oxidase-like deaminating enzyme
MGTVILGGGIIGLATGYYLSLARPPSHVGNSPIHIVDSSHALLLSASGYAGGFVAEDWFSSASASLGALSFKLHRELAEEHDGQNRWGYTGSQVYSLSISGKGVSKSRPKSSKDDWLSSGTSRAGAAPASSDLPEPLNADGSPACFTPQRGGTLSPMGTPDDCAQVHPRSLCNFLLSECQSRGVQLHLSASPTSITTDPATSALTGLTYTTPSSSQPATLPCTTLIFTAGAWTPHLFHTLFPSSQLSLPIYPLAGYSLLARSPRYTTPALLDPSSLSSSSTTLATTAQPRHKAHAIYASPTPRTPYSYAPEVFARLGPDGDPELWIGGLNDPALDLPEKAQEVKGLVDEEMVRDLRGTLVQLCGKGGGGAAEGEGTNEDDLEIVSEGLCFRPVSETGVPVVGRVREEELGAGVKTEPEGRGGVFVASGHGPWGISLSLGTGKVISELVLGQELSADIGRLGVK